MDSYHDIILDPVVGRYSSSIGLGSMMEGVIPFGCNIVPNEYYQFVWVQRSFVSNVGCNECGRVADVEGPRDRRSPKGQGLLRKEGPPTYAILSRNLVLSRFTRFLNGHHRAFYESHPTLGVFSTKVS